MTFTAQMIYGDDRDTLRDALRVVGSIASVEVIEAMVEKAETAIARIDGSIAIIGARSLSDEMTEEDEGRLHAMAAAKSRYERGLKKCIARLEVLTGRSYRPPVLPNAPKPETHAEKMFRLQEAQRLQRESADKSHAQKMERINAHINRNAITLEILKECNILSSEEWQAVSDEAERRLGDRGGNP